MSFLRDWRYKDKNNIQYTQTGGSPSGELYIYLTNTL